MDEATLRRMGIGSSAQRTEVLEAIAELRTFLSKVENIGDLMRPQQTGGEARTDLTFEEIRHQCCRLVQEYIRSFDPSLNRLRQHVSSFAENVWGLSQYIIGRPFSYVLQYTSYFLKFIFRVLWALMLFRPLFFLLPYTWSFLKCVFRMLWVLALLGICGAYLFLAFGMLCAYTIGGDESVHMLVILSVFFGSLNALEASFQLPRKYLGARALKMSKYFPLVLGGIYIILPPFHQEDLRSANIGSAVIGVLPTFLV